MNLSKSRYCSALQCPKILWMAKNMPDQFDDSTVDTYWLDIGNTIGDIARRYFGDFIEVPYAEKKAKMIKETKRLLDKGTPVICEASFAFEGKFCSVDILCVFDGYVDIVEVKSSLYDNDSKADDIDEIYLHDMAYQYFVLTGCGLTVRNVSLLALNRQYTRQGELDIQKLFTLTDCTDTVKAMQADIPGRLLDIEKVIMSEDEPDEVIGSRCDSPYECSYKGWCWRNLPEDNIFNIGWRMKKSDKDSAYQAGIISFEDVLNSDIKLDDKGKQRRQIETALYDLHPHVNKPAIKEFLDDLHYPVYHFDFETFMPPIPPWDGIGPYAMIPFQYSLHIQHEDGSVTHKGFLGEEGTDPRRAIAEQICKDIPVDACVLAWHMPFEKTQLKGLAKIFPDLAEHLYEIVDNMKDLIDPFKYGDYYCKAMGGSSSLKSVLPALFPDDPELSYDNLELVQHGGDAMQAYATLHEKPPEEAEKMRNALIEYCSLDTLAMVKILDKLRELVE